MDWAALIRELTASAAENLPQYKPDPALGTELAYFVIEGGDAQVLDRVDYQFIGALGWRGPGAPGDEHLRRLYLAFDEIPPEVMVRWAQALERSSFLRAGPRVGGVRWPGALLLHVAKHFPDDDLPFDFLGLAALLQHGGVHPAQPIIAAWQDAPEHSWRRSELGPALTRLRGYGAAVAKLHRTLTPLLVEGAVPARLHAFEMLAAVDDEHLVTYAEQIAEAAVGTSAKVRERAAALAARVPGAVADLLRAVATEGKPEQRLHALQLLWDTSQDDEQRAFARDTALADRAASVRALADGFVDEPEAVPVPHVPEPDPVDWAVEWTDEVAAAVTGMVAEQNHWHLNLPPSARSSTRLTAEEVVAAFRELLTSPEPPVQIVHSGHWFPRSASIRCALEAGMIPAVGVVKLLVGGDRLDDYYHGYRDLAWTARLLHEHRGLTLLDLVPMLDGVPERSGVEMLAQAWFADQADGLGRGWAPEALWPAFAAHLDDLLEYWERRREGHSFGFDSEAIFPLVEAFPEPPTRLVELCYYLALGSAKSDQRAAQDFLSTHPDAVGRATAALSDGNGTIRAVAADWLGRLADRDAVPALAAAFAKEKNETVQGALLDALVTLGEPIEAHFDLAAVDAQAAKAMAKWPPAALSWLDADRLPDVRRANGSGTVPRATMIWLVTRATAAKSSVPGALLRACTTQLEPTDRGRFGDALLAQWIAVDEDSVGRTKGSRHAWNPKSPGTGPAASSKGLLALVAACGGARSVTDATRYVRTWHGQRAHQSKALVAMLAHHPHPAAAEALVAIAYRFKAPSIERAAREEVAALAERLGWTPDQLADRTVPTAGFDDAGLMQLSYGERSFTARLLPDLGVEILDPDGRTIKALPSPRQSDDAEAAKDARKALSAAKKQLGETVRLQTVRLHDAMCAQRAWTGAEWRHDLAGHPVLARLVARLVWVAEGEGTRIAFRLLDDGTLTDAADEPVELTSEAEVRIAHDVTLTDAEVAAWQRHLTDYEVSSLFWQLGRGRPALTEEQATSRSLDGRRTKVPSGRLEQVTTRLGYRRGRVGDGAAYDWFEKEFGSLGLRAKLTLEGGHEVGDHESEVTVDGLVVESTESGQPVRLGELPPVLLVELQHDLDVVVGA